MYFFLGDRKVTTRASTIVLFILCGMIGAVCCMSGVVKEPLPVDRRTLVTAAHLGQIAGYTKVYEDTSSDYAVYVKDSYCAEGLASGARVTLAGTSGNVAAVSETEFTVSVDNISKIVPGVSGTSVYYDGTPIGFISGWSGDGTVRCIFY